MRIARAAAAAVGALLALPVAIASCADLLSIEAPIEKVEVDAAFQTEPISYDGGVPILPFDGGPPSCDAAPTVNQGDFFVSKEHGSGNESCGEQSSPCNSVTLGVGRAKAAGGGTVVVAEGHYVETVVLVPDVTIQGGFDDDFAWICNPEAVQIEAPAGSYTTMLAKGISGNVSIASLTVMTDSVPASDETGQSVYGIFLDGQVNLTLNDVIVVAGNAGSGTPGSRGQQGSPGGNGCDVGGGGVGGVGPAGSGGTEGTYGASGYTPGVAQTGEPGSAGGNGSGGQCGGGGGQGGGGGGGGGSSIGIFLNANAEITTTGGYVQSGLGGTGGAGSAGGAGGHGGGGNAGTGGAGGPGGSGAGGDSFAIVHGSGDTETNIAATTVLYSPPAGGKGGPAAQGGGMIGATGLANKIEFE